MNKQEYYLGLAKKVSEMSKCLRGHFGAIIVKNDMMIGAGYNGPARGVAHCNPCRREGDPCGVGYEKCIAVHAEVNAIVQAGGRSGCLGSTMYLASHNRTYGATIYHPRLGDFPCPNCARLIVNGGVKWLINEGGVYEIERLVEEGDIV